MAHFPKGRQNTWPASAGCVLGGRCWGRRGTTVVLALRELLLQGGGEEETANRHKNVKIVNCDSLDQPEGPLDLKDPFINNH